MTAAQPAGPGDPARRPRPAIDADTAFFWGAARRHELVVQECRACGELHFPPEVRCPDCSSDSLVPHAVQGTGTVHSFAVVHRPEAPGFAYPLPVVLVELDEGPRVIAGIVECTREELRIGMAVEVCWLDTHSATDTDPAISLPQFRPVARAAVDTSPARTHGAPTVRPRRPRFAGQVAIAGIGATEFSTDSGRSELRLAVEACEAAIADAGIDRADITGLVTFTMDTNPEDQVMRALGLRELTHFSRVHFGGGGVAGALQHAAMAVDSGASDAVLVYRAFNERSGRRFGAGIGDRPPLPTAESVQFSWTSPHGLLTPASWAAMIATRMLFELDLTEDDFGHVAVAARAHAATNPNARFYGRPITMDDYRSSRWIVEPLRLFDCCQETDAGVALVVTSFERARALASNPVVITAAAQYSARGLHLSRAPFNWSFTGVEDLAGCARQLWHATSLAASDIDAAMLYDAFTPPVLAQLEAFGFCSPGGAAELVRSGEIAPGGSLPVNTHGGQIGEAYVHGLNNVTEAVRQLRGTAANQLGDPEHVLVTASGYMPTSAAILSRA